MKPSRPIGRSTSDGHRRTRHLNAFRGVRAISKFDWPFTPTHTSSRSFSTWCGPPSGVTRTSPWTCVDHLVSRLPPTTQTHKVRFVSCETTSPCSGSLSLRIRVSWRLSLPVTATRRFIMQKARRHIYKMLRPLVGERVQDLFQPSCRSAFHLSLTVLVHYRSHPSI